ncbi:MAG: hypothetical protein WD315_05585 [Balneolaceae bacterium]
MDYIAVIDYEHLDNGMFLSSFARSLSSQQTARGVIIHGDSAYTERLLQSGMMREEATVRSIRDLNHRLIALLADYGVSAIGLNGHQRSLIRMEEESTQLDTNHLLRLPDTPHILLSSLAFVPGRDEPGVLKLPELVALLQKQLQIRDVILFSMNDSDEIIQKEMPETIRWAELEETFSESPVPSEFHGVSFPLRLLTTGRFADYPSTKGTTLITP